MKKIWTVAVLCVCLFAAVGAAFAEDVVNIGVAVSMTGKLAYEGTQVKMGYQVWEKLVNESGGIKAGDKKYKVRMIYLDDESDPVRGAKLTEKLITEDKVQFLMGPYSSAVTFATSAIGEKYGIITIAPEANATKIYERGYKNIFSILPPATLLMDPIAEVAKKVAPKPQTAAIISANDLFPLSCAEGFKASLEKAGIKVVLFEKYPAGATDISSLLTKVKSANPDILGLAGYTADSLMLMRQSKELKLNPKMYAISVGVMVEGFIKELGADAEYAVEGEWWIPGMKLKDPVFGTTEDYVKACRAMFGETYTPGYHAASASAAGSLLQLAVEKAGSIETDKVREALRGMDLQLSTWPGIKFDEKGQNIKTIHPAIQIQKGKFVTVYPEESKQNDIVYPAPAWEERK